MPAYNSIMQRRTRRILFIAAILAFLGLGFGVTMYARGYRWDFKASRLLLTGGVYLKTLSPTEAEVALNAKPTGKTTAALIKNLLPLRKYQATVAKEGYQIWTKEFEITPGFVTGAETVVLFPEKLESEIIWPDAALTDFAVSPNQKFIAAKLNSSRIIIRDLGEVSATATPPTFSDRRKTIAIGFEKNKPWSENSAKFIFWRQTAAGKLWYAWDANTKALTDLTALYERKIVLKQASASPLPAKFNPSKTAWFGNNNMLVLMSGRLFEMDIGNETVTDLKLNDIVDFESFENRIFALKKPDILMLVDSAVENVAVLGSAKFIPQRIMVSPEGEKIVYANDKTLGVFWLKDTSRQPLKKANDQEIVYSGTGEISEVFWHRYGEHLMFLENQKLKTAEFDTRPPLNIAQWSETILALDYLARESKLYLLESEAIKSVKEEF